MAKAPLPESRLCMFIRSPANFQQSFASRFLQNRDFSCYGEIFVPITWGPLACLLGFRPSGPKPCGGNDVVTKLLTWFLFLFTGKTCPLYAAPKNGALACHKIGSDYVCSAMCKNEFDFSFNPPTVYYCSAGQWQFFSVFPLSQQLPWPDCSSKLILLLILSVKLYGLAGQPL